MAIYPYKCLVCGREKEVYQSIASYSEAPDVPECCHEKPMMRVMTAPMVAADFQASFVSPIDGTVIASRAQQREHMLKHGVVHYDEIAPDIARNKKAMQEKAKVGVKQDLVEAMHRVEAGYKPQVPTEAEIIPA